MAYRQPRVPELHEGESLSRYIKILILFLKEFANQAWTAHRENEKELAQLKKRIRDLEEKGA